MLDSSTCRAANRINPRGNIQPSDVSLKADIPYAASLAAQVARNTGRHPPSALAPAISTWRQWRASPVRKTQTRTYLAKSCSPVLIVSHAPQLSASAWPTWHTSRPDGPTRRAGFPLLHAASKETRVYLVFVACPALGSTTQYYSLMRYISDKRDYTTLAKSVYDKGISIPSQTQIPACKRS